MTSSTELAYKELFDSTIKCVCIGGFFFYPCPILTSTKKLVLLEFVQVWVFNLVSFRKKTHLTFAPVCIDGMFDIRCAV